MIEAPYLARSYAIGLNMNHNTKIPKWIITERIASAAFVF